MANLVLYILMRTDMASMNPGKSCAQAGHAANQMTHDIEKSGNNKAIAMLDKWKKSTPGGFGTCLVLGVNAQQLYGVIAAIEAGSAAYPSWSHNIPAAAVVNDPTYPLRDGDFTHFIRVDTCGYIFGDKEIIKSAIADFNLNLMP